MKKNLLFVFALCCSAAPSYALDVADPSETFIREADKNHDNKVSLKEFLAIGRGKEFLAIGRVPEGLAVSFPITRESFRRLDTDRNGYLNKRDQMEGIRYSAKAQCHIENWGDAKRQDACPK